MNDIEQQVLLAVRKLYDIADRGRFVKSANVIRQVLEDQGRLDAVAEAYLQQKEHEHSEAEVIYDVIVQLVLNKSGQPNYLEGQGNFGGGSPAHPPAHPRFTDCRITARGIEYLDRKLKEESTARKKKGHSTF